MELNEIRDAIENSIYDIEIGGEPGSGGWMTSQSVKVCVDKIMEIIKINFTGNS